MVRGTWFPQGSDLTQPLALRQAVFATGRDALDDLAQQVVVYEGELPVGTARLWWQEGAFYLGDLGVLPSHRGRGFGDLLTRLALYKVLVHQGREVRLAAPTGVVSFFARYGFAPIQGAGDTDFVPMRLSAGEIRLDACGGCGGCPQGAVPPGATEEE